ncbi:hypothetical protein JCM6292_3578 [Bacteroides pyogenes JCM 6292]|uniref:Uncharacterized protein n=1 Tax=Bacteroides pyogenes JCM 6292 TaxID=1235809 RepID=W4PBD9_9BACE|nr:hypothetical protein JCM6292_3578 [Bacteroides pyogenes JCM 6292]
MQKNRECPKSERLTDHHSPCPQARIQRLRMTEKSVLNVYLPRGQVVTEYRKLEAQPLLRLEQ